MGSPHLCGSTTSVISISFSKLISLAFLLLAGFSAKTEGSKDFVDYPGYRLFLDTRDQNQQQLKVYANEGEFINVGASHVGIEGGFISVFNPMGELVAIFDNTGATAGMAIINNNIEEQNGPTGTANGGYEPGVIEVLPGQVGVWTIVFDYPTYELDQFQNILNSAPWTRQANQPNSQRVVLAWDIAITTGNPGNMGGLVIEGRVFTNEYVSVLNFNNFSSSPTFYVLTQDGFLYQVNATDIDPFRFPISSNSLGLLNYQLKPIYSSRNESSINRSIDPTTWLNSSVSYLYEPQARDSGPIINNKIFFNIPDPLMPTSATTTDIYRDDTHATWLYKSLEVLELDSFYLFGQSAGGNLPCDSASIEYGQGGAFIFETNLGGVVTLQLDLNNNGLFNDPVDVTLQGAINQGIDQVYWDGNDGLGNPIPVQQGFTFNCQGSIKFGELHIALTDVENCPGGVTFEWLNAPAGYVTDQFYYDHSPSNGPVSGGGSPGNALPTNIPFSYGQGLPYGANWGDVKYLDHWMLIEHPIALTTISVDIVQECMGVDNDINPQLFSGGFDHPTDLAHAGDERLFVAEKNGYIWVLDENGNRLPQPFLDLHNIVGGQGSERGLLGLAFHPDYANNGYFYVNYTVTFSDELYSRVCRFKVSSSNPNVADPTSEFLLLQVAQPFVNNNGGCLKFGPDGYLYVGFGDGGSQGDVLNNAQKRNTFLGKMLRMDVNNGLPYGIPPDNPFVNDPNTLDEIWSLGLRNPMKFSFDRLTGDLWIGDKGQGAWEEIDREAANGPGGQNYGWRCYEGSYDYNTAGCTASSNLTFPVHEYPAFVSTGCSVIGGYVYRGCGSPAIKGKYIFGDYCSGRIWSMAPDGNGAYEVAEISDLADNNFISFGENSAGDLFLLGYNDGTVMRLTTNTTPTNFLQATDVSCAGDNNGGISFTIPTNNFLSVNWNDGSTDLQRTNLAPGTYVVTITDNQGCLFSDEIEVMPGDSITANAIAIQESSCFNMADGIAMVTANSNQPNPNYTYLWDNGNNTMTANNLTQGIHSVTVSNLNSGCSTIAAINIGGPDELLADAVISQTISCFGENDGAAQVSITWSGTDYNILWSNGSTGETASGLAAGSYSVTVTYNNGACESVDEIVLAEPDLLLAEAIAQQNISCFGENDGSAQVNITWSGTDYEVLWSNGSTGETASGLTAGSYSVTVTYNNGACESVDEIVLDEPTQLVAEANGIQNISCFGGNDGFAQVGITGGTAPYTVLWSNGQMGLAIENLEAGSYNATVTDANGCTQVSNEISMIEPNSALIADTSSTPAILNNADGTATATPSGGVSPYSYLWNTSPPQTTPTAIDLLAGDYSVTITDALGCQLVLTITVDMSTGTEEFLLPGSQIHFKLYPNLTAGSPVKLEVLGHVDAPLNICVFSASGQHLSTNKIVPNNGAQTLLLDFSTYAEGAYFVSVEWEGKMWTLGKVIRL